MSTYTVTLTSESTGKVTSKTITAADARAAVAIAYQERYDVTPGHDSIRPRGMDISDREFIVIGTAGAVTLADVEPATVKVTITAQPGVTPDRAARAYLNSLDAEGIESRPNYSDAIATGTVDGQSFQVYAHR